MTIESINSETISSSRIKNLFETLPDNLISSFNPGGILSYLDRRTDIPNAELVDHRMHERVMELSCIREPRSLKNFIRFLMNLTCMEAFPEKRISLENILNDVTSQDFIISRDPITSPNFTTSPNFPNLL